MELILEISDTRETEGSACILVARSHVHPINPHCPAGCHQFCLVFYNVERQTQSDTWQRPETCSRGLCLLPSGLFLQPWHLRRYARVSPQNQEMVLSARHSTTDPPKPRHAVCSKPTPRLKVEKCHHIKSRATQLDLKFTHDNDASYVHSSS